MQKVKARKNFHFRFILIGTALFLLSSCSPPKDPSEYDLKSPCVSNDYGIPGYSPCIRKKPLENYLA